MKPPCPTCGHDPEEKRLVRASGVPDRWRLHGKLWMPRAVIPGLLELTAFEAGCDKVNKALRGFWPHPVFSVPHEYWQSSPDVEKLSTDQLEREIMKASDAAFKPLQYTFNPLPDSIKFYKIKTEERKNLEEHARKMWRS